MPAKLTTVPGQRFGLLTVLEEDAAKMGSGETAWICQCDCGVARSFLAYRLRSGHTRSCGCLKDAQIRERSRKHGCAGKTTEYTSWGNMLSRCLNPNDPNYADYGDRGIAVDPSWRSFVQFMNDMGPKPTPGHSIDRIDNDGPYAPWNCRWATRSEQARNKRNSIRVTYGGQTKSVHEWAEQIGIKPDALIARLIRGWPAERALTYHVPTPVAPSVLV